MAKFNRMTMWEVNRRLATLIQFRELVITYYDNVERESLCRLIPNQTAAQARCDLNSIFDDARESMYLAGFYGIVGSRYGSVSLVENPFVMNELIRPEWLVDEIEKAIGKYERSLHKATMRTLNPFFWLNQLLATILGFPFRLLASAGLVNESKLDSSPLLRIPKAILVFVGTLLTYAVGIVTVTEKLGYLDALKNWVNRIF